MSIDEKNMNIFLEYVADIVGDNSLKRKSLEQLKSLRLSQNECIHVIDFSQNSLVYSNGFHNLLGYDDKEISIEFIENLYHPEDVEIINRIIKASILYCLDHPEDSTKNVLYISFRLRKKDGTYIKVLSQSSIYDFAKNGQMTSTLIRFTDITFLDSSTNVNWDFKAPDLNKETFKQQVYKTYNDFFTKREKEIIIAIKNKLLNKEIAKSLNISEHTVATHRKRILKKAGCHNPVQLILFCKGKGII